MVAEDERMIDVVEDTKIVLSDGREMTYRELARILTELDNPNLLRSMRLLMTEDIERAADFFGLAARYLNKMQEVGNQK